MKIETFRFFLLPLLFVLAVTQLEAQVSTNSSSSNQLQQVESTASSPKDIYGLQFIETDTNGTVYYDKRGNAEIFVPSDYHLVPPRFNRQVVYDFGLKHNTEPFEVRIRFSPPPGPSQEERKKIEQQYPGSVYVGSADPEEQRSTMWAMTMVMNLSGGSGLSNDDYVFFNSEAVKREFGADWGLASVVFELKDADFAGSYHYGQIGAQIHKKKVGSYTIIRVFNSVDVASKLGLGAFHVVFFR